MSGMTDCSYKEGSVLDEDVKNDYLNSMTGFGVLNHVRRSTDKMMVYLNTSILIYLCFPRTYS
jgi:hypothetical protein